MYVVLITSYNSPLKFAYVQSVKSFVSLQIGLYAVQLMNRFHTEFDLSGILCPRHFDKLKRR